MSKIVKIVRVWLKGSDETIILETEFGDLYPFSYLGKEQVEDLIKQVETNKTSFGTIEWGGAWIKEDFHILQELEEFKFVPKDTQDFQLQQLRMFMCGLGYCLDQIALLEGKFRFIAFTTICTSQIISFNNAVVLFNSSSNDWETYSEGTRAVSKILPWFNCNVYQGRLAYAGKAIEEVKLSYGTRQHKLFCYDYNVKFVEKAFYELWKKGQF